MGLLTAGIRVYMLVILVRAIFSWLPSHHRQNEVYLFIFRITEPVLAPLRRVLPPMGGLDLSPLVVIVICELMARAIMTAGR